MSKEKKNALLGMNVGTASNRLVKDLLFDFVEKSGQNCFQCGKALTRETFSIEHKNAWMQQEDPLKAFFDLSNVAFSHLSCNIAAATRYKAPCGTVKKYDNGCRCAPCVEAAKVARKKYYTTELRQAAYKREKARRKARNVKC